MMLRLTGPKGEGPPPLAMGANKKSAPAIHVSNQLSSPQNYVIPHFLVLEIKRDIYILYTWVRAS